MSAARSSNDVSKQHMAVTWAAGSIDLLAGNN
jgi:hypothetical protein